ncbi:MULTISPECIES: hypothetical protein [Micrococcus]|uniref:Uncharacterized membrane protein YciS (DUF1049 family) n=1 Tax=Micrococcus yunnanensis TaxID=566027 RepID=A0ABR6CZI3_9MICC|nr:MULTISPECIES: hypothetical protein [Micrococcus]TFI18571.1 hypothetical protein E4P35_03945 [Thiopseudomonas sp. 4R-3cl]MBA9059242.1 uncharacterized membrane protein YciS (DUF1049 family) [Micrococcus yunnanensis]MCV7459198.1 hypothetical protein [Micrococcus luteus]MCV7523038.1 hypothetical protein [Micrococcus luteus]MCV7563253.1 hypothetical protein [Micrococcus luteus]
MSQSLTPGPDGARRGPRAGLRVGSLGFVAMIVILIVAIIFAANQNDVIGWLVVAVAAGWLVFAVVVYLQMRRGVRAAGRKVDTAMQNARADVAALRGRDADAAAPAVVPPAPAADPLRDTKLDHSFKIAQVQVRVVREQLAAGEGMDREMVDRALETIDITASNARDMIKESRAGGAEGPVSGTVIG